MNNKEIEVFRLTPIKDKSYFYAEATRKTGIYPNIKYYTNNKLKYVGKFIVNVLIVTIIRQHHRLSYSRAVTNTY